MKQAVDWGDVTISIGGQVITGVKGISFPMPELEDLDIPKFYVNPMTWTGEIEWHSSSRISTIIRDTDDYFYPITFQSLKHGDFVFIIDKLEPFRTGLFMLDNTLFGLNAYPLRILDWLYHVHEMIDSDTKDCHPVTHELLDKE